MPIKSKVFIKTLQKSQDWHKIDFAFEFNNKNTKKVFGPNLPPPPPPIHLSWIYPQIQLGLREYWFRNRIRLKLDMDAIFQIPMIGTRSRSELFQNQSRIREP